MIPIEHESGSSVLIDIHGIPERGSVVVSSPFWDNNVLANVGDDIDNKGDDIFSEESLPDEFIRKAEDMSFRLFVDVEFRVC